MFKEVHCTLYPSLISPIVTDFFLGIKGKKVLRKIRKRGRGEKKSAGASGIHQRRTSNIFFM